MKEYGTEVYAQWLNIKERRLERKAVIFGGIIPLLQFIFSFFPPRYIIQNEVRSAVAEDYILKTICCFVLYVLSLYIMMASRSMMSSLRTSAIEIQDHDRCQDNDRRCVQIHSSGSLSGYLSKYILLQMMVFLSIISYFISGIIFSVMDFYIHRAGEKFIFFDPVLIGTVFFKLCIAIMGITALQLMVSTVSGRWIWQVFAGSLGIIASLYSLGSETRIPYLPYDALYLFRNASSIRALSHVISFSEYLSMLWTLLLLLTGAFLYRQKRRSNAKSGTKGIIVSVIYIASGMAIFHVLQKPDRYQAKYRGIVIQGTMVGDQQLDSVKIFTNHCDTRRELPRVKYSFLRKTDHALSMDEYVPELGNKIIPLCNGRW